MSSIALGGLPGWGHVPQLAPVRPRPGLFHFAPGAVTRSLGAVLLSHRFIGLLSGSCGGKAASNSPELATFIKKQGPELLTI
jgi:hypothetical protein